MAFYTPGADKTLAPNPGYPERTPTTYEGKIAGNPSRRGPLRFEEGVATDTDVPNDFVVGAMQGYNTAPGRPNHNANVWEKPAAETMRERAHVGSATWPESQTYIGEFAHGTQVNANAARRFEEVNRGNGLGSRHQRVSPVVVTD